MADPGAQLGQILAAKKWSAGIELLERMMDWNEVLDLLKKADRYFNLGLAKETATYQLTGSRVKFDVPILGSCDRRRQV